MATPHLKRLKFSEQTPPPLPRLARSRSIYPPPIQRPRTPCTVVDLVSDDEEDKEMDVVPPTPTQPLEREDDFDEQEFDRKHKSFVGTPSNGEAYIIVPRVPSDYVPPTPIVETQEEDEVPPAITQDNPNSKGREWCFTWPIEATARAVLPGVDINLAKAYGANWIQKVFNEHCSYLIYGFETGTSEFAHFQGFLVLKKKQRFSYLKKIFPKEVHLEQMAAFSSVEKNIEYCSKEGSVVVLGEPPLCKEEAAASGGRHGRRGGEMEVARWETANRLAMAGDFDEIDPQIKICHFGNILKVHSYATRDVSILEKPCGHWLYGVPGSGKSWKARHSFGTSVYLKAANKWFDGYNDQDYILIEDLDPSHAWMANHLKCWMDVYPFSAEIKGGVMQIRPKGIIITSNYSMHEIFGASEVDVLAIKRRCEVTHFPYAYGAAPVAVSTEEFVISDHQQDVEVN